MRRVRVPSERVWLVFLGLAPCAIAIDMLVPGGELPKQLLYDGLGLASAAAMILGVRHWRPRSRAPWYLFAAGQLSFVVGDSIRAFYELVLNVDAPLFSAADAFYLAAYPFLAAGLFSLVRSRDPSRDRSSLIDATIVAVGAAVVVYVFLVLPYATDPSLSGLERAISIAYPLADLVLLSFAARLAAGPGARSTAYGLLGLSILTLLAADTFYAISLLNQTYATGSPSDAGFLLSYVLWGTVALHPSMSGLSEPAPDPEVGLTRRRLAILATASFIAPLVGTIQSIKGEEGSLSITRAATIVLFLLVLARMAGVVRLLSQSLAREREAEANQRASERRFRSLVQNSSDVTTVTDADGTITYQSTSVEPVLGLEAQELVGRRFFELVHPEDVDGLQMVCHSLVEGVGRRQARTEFRWRHRNGGWLCAEATIADSLADADVRGLVFNTRDASERKKLEEQLTHQAFHDDLTGLANRSLFRDRVEHALAWRKSLDEPVSVLFLDVDDFKTVNDSLGHYAGDELLIEIARRIRGSLREGDTAARLGGDEFAILLEDGADPPAVARRLIDSFAAPFGVGGKELTVTVSIGIARSAFNHDGASELLRNADAAMYAAKGRGKGFYELFEQSMHTSALRRLDLEGELRRAVHRAEFRVHYQPILDVATGRVVGFEALVRWAHPARGLLSPGDFVPLAEETGLIVPVGRAVLREACRQIKGWQAEHRGERPLTISVNLSAQQLEDAGLLGDIEAALADSGLDPESLTLEVTESALMRDTAAAVARLEAVKALGVRVAIDDFGTGFSSLAYLQNLPCDSLKIPKPFLDELAQGGSNSFVRAISDLGRALDLTVVAEGVEEAAQWEALKELSCDLVQGYYFARPQSAERIEALLRRNTLSWEISVTAEQRALARR